VNVFDLDRALVSDYERFARSFTRIRAADILSQIVSLYATNRFWPEPLISINPHFERGASIDKLTAEEFGACRYRARVPRGWSTYPASPPSRAGRCQGRSASELRGDHGHRVR